jgi:hypothetical protein
MVRGKNIVNKPCNFSKEVERSGKIINNEN